MVLFRIIARHSSSQRQDKVGNQQPTALTEAEETWADALLKEQDLRTR